ncbi:MAG TPA: TonB-dependent receptor [Steroidobacteraceae bacterium]|nr:TonB-dependent receptor [Steroidobacteraceae bacterium]
MTRLAPPPQSIALRITPIAAAVAGILHGGLYSAAAYAADAATAAADTELQEIVVTGTRRAQNVVDVPFNISAVSGETIETQNLVNPVDLLRTVPGVSVVDRGIRNAGVVNNVRIRGVNVDGATLGDYAVAGTEAVSTYVNETPIFANFLLKDIDRVEVLRGPQGTLYGRGSMGGTVRYILREPVLGETSGSVSAGLSSTTGSSGMNWTTDGTLNLPAGDSFALRANYSHLDDAGVVDYVNLYKLDANGIPVAPNGVLDPAAEFTSKKDADWAKIDYGRLAATWKPTDAAKFVLSVVGQKDRTGGRRQIVAPGTPNYATGGVYGDYDQGAVMLEPSERQVTMTSLEANVDLGFASLTSSTSYTDHTGSSTNDNSGLYGKNWPFLYDYYPRLMAQKYRNYSDRGFVQELRLVSDTKGFLDYLAGAYFEDRRQHSGETDWVRGFTQWWTAQNAADPGSVSYYDPVAPTSDRDFLYSRREHFKEIALFGELTFHLTSSMQITGGVRGFRDLDQNAVLVVPDLPTRVGESAPVVPDTTKNKAIFKLNYSWKFTAQENFYVTGSQGYRRGGVNDIPTTGYIGENPGWINFKPDTLNNYEVGIKGAHDWFDYNVSAFLIDWKDIQLNTQTPVWGYYVTTNAGKARSQGVELQFNGKITESLRYGLGYTYDSAKLTRDATRPYAPFVVIAPEGTRLPAAPQNVLNASLDYTIRLNPRFTLVPHVDAYYQSGTYNQLAATTTAAIPISSYTLWNASAALNAERWTLTLFCRNLGNAKAISGIFSEATFGSAPADGFPGDTSRELITTPRTVGLIAKYRF